MTLSSETLIRLWSEIGAGVARSGVRKLVLFNAHGGHTGAMDIVARELRAAHGLIVYSVSWFNLPLGDAGARFSADEHRFGVHAGDMETSMMLALAPDLVAMEAARDFGSTSRQRAADYAILGNGRSAKLGWAMEDYNPEGAAGNAAAATRRKGACAGRAAATQLAALLAEVSRLPLSTAHTQPLPPTLAGHVVQPAINGPAGAASSILIEPSGRSQVPISKPLAMACAFSASNTSSRPGVAENSCAVPSAKTWNA